MRFLARTIVDHIVEEAVEERAYRYVLPSYPSELLVAIGAALEEQLSRREGRRVRFVCGIAYRLGEAWRGSGLASDEANLEMARERGWYNADDNLTSLRNRVRDPEREDTLVTVLAGYDHIDDRASLQDFFHLDDGAVWAICLHKSFRRWVEWRFADVLSAVDEATAIGRIADAVLAKAYDHGLADLVGISAYLEGLDLTGVSNGGEAYRLVLGDLRAFNLPPMMGLARARGKKTLASYIREAQEFANYGRFLEATARRRALQAIERYRASDPQEPDAELLGEFGSLEELLASLRRYIEERSEEDRAKLLRADFPFIHERVLGHRGPVGPRRRQQVVRLRGVAPEVFLRAMWLTLGEYRSAGRGATPAGDETPERITMRSVLFRHDFDAGDGDEEQGGSDDDRAREFLRRVLGGIDAWLAQMEVGGIDGAPAARVESALCPDEDGAFGYQRTHVGEPYLKFEVTVASAGARRVRREYLWCLPQEHGARLLETLCMWALEAFRRGGNALPAYAVPHIPEVFLARDEDEVTRVLGVAVGSQGRRVVDLLSAQGIEPEDPALGPLLQVSARFQGFLRAVEERGFFAALQGPFDDLRLAYRDACQTLLHRGRESALQPLLLKAFYVVDGREAAAGQWKWQTELGCAVATPLHPAVLDMIRQQHTFLAESFCLEASDELTRRVARPFSERSWGRVTDLARIERPVFGTLKDSAGALDSRVRSYGYFHLVGQCRAPSAQMSGRLLLDYEDEEDEEVSDGELFSETRASSLVCHTLMDYRALHAHADDGMAVGAYCGREIQPVVAGIDAFLKEVLGDKDRGERPYGLQVTVFSTGRDDSAVTRWLDAWRDRWQQAELASSRRHYEHCRITIAYRVVADAKGLEHLARLVGATPLDVMLLMDFVEAGTDRFEDLGPGDLSDTGYRQFPVLEKACCAVRSGGKAAQRERVLSHARFGLATLQAEVMARISKGNAGAEQRHVVIRRSDFGPWERVMAAAHARCGWVVCIDPAVDDQLLRQGIPAGETRREIIGFGAGVGASGESNYTVSTEQFSLADVRRRLGQQLSVRLGPWDAEVRERVAESLVSAAGGMAGLSVVKATGPSEYVRDYAAYATLRTLLPRDPEAFCDEIVSLDAFHHWFDDAPVKTRPDLLRLRAKLVEGHLAVEAQVVECKLAQQSEAVLREAREQVRHGLERLVGRFRPRPEGATIGIGDRPDQRYWWMQLHRLIATRASTSLPRYRRTLMALERMAEGLFSISWQGAAVAFWTDVDGDALQREAEWQIEIDGEEMTVPAITAGRELIRRVCLDGVSADIFAGVPALRRSSWVGAARSEGAPVVEPVDEVTARVEEVERHEVVAAEDEVDDGRAEVGVAAEVPSEPVEQVVMPAPDARVVERVLLGHRVPGNRPVYWEFGHEDLPNRHILVFGASGTGKTYTIQALLCEFGKAGQNALIVDYTSGFTTSQLEEVLRERLRPRQHMVRREPLPINPFRKQADVIDDVVLDEDPSITAQRVTGVFSEVYQLGDQQKSALYTVIRDGIEGGDGAFGLEALAEGLEELREAGGPVATPAASVLSRIQPFIDMHPFGREDPESWESLYTDAGSRCHIIQLAGYSKDVQRLITEFSLIDLYRYYRAQGSKDRPRVVVLDEIQNLDHSLGSPMGQLLTEGRKFGISLVLATQTLSSLDRDARDRLFQASHKLFFKPADTELPSFAQILANATSDRSEEWVQRLSSLSRGECYSLGPTRNEASGGLDMKKYHKIRITSLGERY